MIISLEGDTTAMQTLNETGAFLFRLLQNGASESELAEKLMAEYEVDSLVAKNDIDKFISSLTASGFIE